MTIPPILLFNLFTSNVDVGAAMKTLMDGLQSEQFLCR